MLIDEEEKKINASNGKYPRATKDKLVEMRNTHRENVKTMQAAIKANRRPNVELEEIDVQLARLKSLKHSGPNLVQILGTIDRARINQMQQTADTSFYSNSVVKHDASVKSMAIKFVKNVGSTLSQIFM